MTNARVTGWGWRKSGFSEYLYPTPRKEREGWDNRLSISVDQGDRTDTSELLRDHLPSYERDRNQCHLGDEPDGY